jgi:hypothetical protein
MKITQRATITSINHLNKTFEVKITNNSTALCAADNGKVLLPLPKEKFRDFFEVGDEIEFKKFGNNDFKIINLTCVVLRLSRFKRDLNSILRRLDNDDHKLKRCVLLNEPSFVLLSAKKNPEKLMLLQNQLESEENHETF